MVRNDGWLEDYIIVLDSFFFFFLSIGVNIVMNLELEILR